MLFSSVSLHSTSRRIPSPQQVTVHCARPFPAALAAPVLRRRLRRRFGVVAVEPRAVRRSARVALASLGEEEES